MAEPGDAARLVVLAEGGERELALGERVTMGRAPDGELVLSELRASRCHAEICRVGSSHYRIQDLGSLNGTFVNGQRIAGWRELFHGDEIEIGGTRLRFVFPSCLRDTQPPADPLLAQPPAAATEAPAAAPEPPGAALVASVRSYGSLAEKLPRAALAEFAQSWHHAAAAHARARGGTAAPWDDTGTLLVRWPPGAEPPRAASSALEAAREILEGAAQFAALFRERFESGFFELGVGLHWCEQSPAPLHSAAELARELADASKEKGYSVLVSREVARLASAAGAPWSFRELGELVLGDGAAVGVLALASGD